MKNHLREYRSERDISQADLAEAVGVSRQTINAIERDRYDPSLELAFALADYFGVRIEELFEPDDSALPGPASTGSSDGETASETGGDPSAEASE